MILNLLFYQLFEVDPLIKLVCFSTRVTDPPLRVKVFGNLMGKSSDKPAVPIRQVAHLHHLLTVHPQKHTAHLL